ILTEPTITPDLVASHGLKPDEYERILKLIGREPSFPEIDERLDGERRRGREKRLHRLDATGLPDGAMIIGDDATFLALRGDAALLWSPAGYVARRSRPTGPVLVCTPPASLAALAHGFQPRWHASVTALV
ncbi:MAG: hypothetical protein J0I67_01315, partial [Bosea sp.]|nr:hypothetical protein [Bosea sp. (in: a-proteobacteria)]